MKVLVTGVGGFIGAHVASRFLAAGHAVIGSYVILGGLSAVHQFARIGDYAFVGGMSAQL